MSLKPQLLLPDVVGDGRLGRNHLAADDPYKLIGDTQRASSLDRAAGPYNRYDSARP